MKNSLEKNDIFRKEAIEDYKDRLHGNVVISLPKTTLYIITSIFLILILSVYIATSISFEKKVSVEGIVLPESGTVPINNVPGYSVESIMIKLGDRVAKGQPLLKFQRNQTTPNGKALDNLTIENLQRRVLDEKSIQKIRLEKANKDLSLIAKNIASKKDQLNLINQQIDLTLSKIEVSENIATAQKRLLDKNLVSKLEWSHIKIDIINTLSEKVRLEERLLEVESKLLQLKKDKSDLLNEMQLARLNSKSKTESLRMQISEAKLRRSFFLEAPSSGFITSLNVSPGQSSPNSNLRIATITPDTKNLVVKAIVPPNKVSNIKIGQRVSLRFDSLPYRLYGLKHGTVSKVSEAAIQRSDPNNVGIMYDNPISGFPIEVTLSLNNLGSKNDGYRVRSGTSVILDIFQQNQTTWEWLLHSIKSP